MQLAFKLMYNLSYIDTHAHVVKKIKQTAIVHTYVTYGVDMCVHMIEIELKLPADHVIKCIKARLKVCQQILVVYPSAVPKCEL